MQCCWFEFLISEKTNMSLSPDESNHLTLKPLISCKPSLEADSTLEDFVKSRRCPIFWLQSHCAWPQSTTWCGILCSSPNSPCLGSVTSGPGSQGQEPLTELPSSGCLLFPADNGLLISHPSCLLQGPLRVAHTPRQHSTLFSCWLACWGKWTPPFQPLDYGKWLSSCHRLSYNSSACMFSIGTIWIMVTINTKQSCKNHCSACYKIFLFYLLNSIVL